MRDSENDSENYNPEKEVTHIDCEICRKVFEADEIANCKICKKRICPNDSYVGRDWTAGYCINCWDKKRKV